MILNLLITSALLSTIMYLVAKHEADYSLPKVIIMTVGISICSLLATALAGPWVALIITLGVTVWALHQFCYLRWKMAWLITGIFIITQVIFNLVKGLLFRGLVG